MVTKLKESIHILNNINKYINDSLDAVIDTCNRYPVNEEYAETLFYTSMNLGLIYINSYMDELNSYFYRELKSEEGKEVIDVLIKRIKIPKKQLNEKFPDIKELRNSFLAHNMRADKNNSQNILFDGGLRKLKVPQNTLDYIFVLSCIKMITAIINDSFPSYYYEAESHRIESSKEIGIKSPEFNSLLEVEELLNEMKEKINAVHISME